MIGVGGTLLGSIVTHWFTGRGEERRLTHEDLTRFHVERHEVYSRVLSHLGIIRRCTEYLSLSGGKGAEEVNAYGVDHVQWMLDARDLLASIDLVGDEQVIGAANTAIACVAAGPAILAGLTPMRKMPPQNDLSEGSKNAGELFQSAY
jgi:hypothetical protein